MNTTILVFPAYVIIMPAPDLQNLPRDYFVQRYTSVIIFLWIPDQFF